MYGDVSLEPINNKVVFFSGFFVVVNFRRNVIKIAECNTLAIGTDKVIG